MTNINYFLSICDKDFSLSVFRVKVSRSHPLHSFTVQVFKGELPLFDGYIDLTRRSILLSLNYSSPLLCKFSPYELREWSPAAFLPYSNYLDFMKFFALSLDIFNSKNPKLS